MRILILSDTDLLTRTVSGILNDVHPVVVTTSRIEEACERLLTEVFDLFVLDLDMHSHAPLKVFQDCPPSVFSLAVASESAKSKIHQAIQAGATDFIVRPFDPPLFRLRIGMAVAHPPEPSRAGLSFGRLTFNVAHNSIELDGNFLALSPNESAVLLALMRRSGAPVSKDFISRSIAGDAEYASNTAVEICIHRLRKKLAGAGVSITTVRGIGYALRFDEGEHANGI